MTKYLLLLSLIFSTTLIAEEINANEAELRMLEQKDEAAFVRAEAITKRAINSEPEILIDSVSTINASIKKDQLPQPKHPDNHIESSDIFIPPQPAVKVRRVRSR